MSRLQKCKTFSATSLLFYILILDGFAQEWNCELFPVEQKIEIDEKSGAKITFITTSKSNDTNLYFHDNCWLFDGRIMLFNSDEPEDKRYLDIVKKQVS